MNKVVSWILMISFISLPSEIFAVPNLLRTIDPGAGGRINALIEEVDRLDNSKLSSMSKPSPSLADTYDKFSYGHQLIYLDPRSSDTKNKKEIENKIRTFGKNLGNDVLVILLNADVTETRKAFIRIMKHFDIDPSIYSPTDGPFLIGHVQIEKAKSSVIGKLHLTDFSGMNTACMKDYIDNIEWSFNIGTIGEKAAAERWATRSLICEGSKIVSDGYSKSINEAFQYFKVWFNNPFSAN